MTEKKEIDRFIKQVEHLIDEYTDCGVTYGEFISAFANLQFDMQMELRDMAESDEK